MQLFKTGDAIDDFPKPSAPAMNLKSPSKWQVLRDCFLSRARCATIS